MFAVLGFGDSVAGVSGMTLVQRTVADEVMARVFGVIQMLNLASMGIGAALAPVLIAAFGLEWALVITGAFLPILVLVTRPWLSRIDAAAQAPQADELRILDLDPDLLAASRARRSRVSRRASSRSASIPGQ